MFVHTTLPTRQGLFDDEGGVVLGRLRPPFFWERNKVTEQATTVLRAYLGDRVSEP